MTRTIQGILLGPLIAALLFVGGVWAATSLAATFWLAPPVHTVLLLAPLPFLLLFVLAQWRFLRRAEGEERAILHEAILFAIITSVSVLGLGELFALLGARLWDPAGIWHWVVLLACLLGARRACIRRA